MPENLFILSPLRGFFQASFFSELNRMSVKNATNTGKEYIPEQYTGNKVNAIEKLELETEQEAIRFFNVVKKRFLDVNHWGETAKLPMSAFRLTDAEGDEISRPALEGDYIKIDIPGPGTSAGDGVDWVIIEELVEDKNGNADLISMRARPTFNPQKHGEDIAHFLKEEATSTFQVKRIGKVIYAEEHGRNELANTNTGKTTDNIRNTIVGWAAKLGFSYPQWKSLVKGWLRRD